MKKIYVFLSAIFLISMVNAQNLIVGGDMESGDAWTVLNVSPDPAQADAPDTSMFNYTDAIPTAGSGGCFYSHASTTGPQVTSAVYQKVTINKGTKYVFNMAFKSLVSMDATWMEAFYSIVEPQEFVDWVEDTAPIDSTWKFAAWNGTSWGGVADDYDETLADAADWKTDTVFVDGTGTIDIYIGFKYGAGWATTSYGYLIDNVVLEEVKDEVADDGELIVGGNMESGDAWTVLNVSSDAAQADAPDTSMFNYTDDVPSAGAGGCFYSHASTTGPQVTSAVYQKVTINKGTKYVFNMAFKSLVSMDATWMEAFYSVVEPQEFVDWVEDTAPIDSTWKFAAWNGTSWGGVADDYDEPLADAADWKTDTVFIEGSGTVDIYIGFKYGAGWATTSYGYLIDNVSLMKVKAIEPPVDGELIVGGNMESGNAWTVLNVSPDAAQADAPDTSMFNYTDDVPSAGAGGCFYSHASTTGPQVTSAVYQKVTINKGTKYVFNMAFKSLVSMDATWMEAFYSVVEPQEFIDWVEDTAPIDSTWKFAAWNGTSWGGIADDYDETLADAADWKTDTVFIEGTGTIDIYIGFKYGAGWATTNYGYLVDNVSLKEVIAVEPPEDGQLIVGGNMESTSVWNVLNVSPDAAQADAPDTSMFNYTDAIPTAGAGGCFYSHASTTEPQVTTAVYQKVNIEKGTKYVFNMAFKSLVSMDATWMEAFYSIVEPQEFVDWVEDTAPIDSTWKFAAWNGTSWGGVADDYDETLADAADWKTDTVFIDGTGTIDIYIGFKYGAGWATTSYGYLVDNVSLKEAEISTAVREISMKKSLKVYPNPALNKLNIENVDSEEIHIYNLLGKRMYSTIVTSDLVTIDISSFNTGIYILQAGSVTSKFIKK